MSMLTKLAEAFRDFNAAFGLTAAHDYDLPDEPPAATWPPRLTDSASRDEISGSHLGAETSPLRAVPDLGDGPTAPAPPAGPGAVGHFNDMVTRLWTLLDALQHFVGELDSLAGELTAVTAQDPRLAKRLDDLFAGS